MLELYRTKNADVHEKLNKLLQCRLSDFRILKTENGKPYIAGNPLHFSLSHSHSEAVIVISDKPVGVDIEVPVKRNYRAVLTRFTPREQQEIGESETAFLTNWVAKEAYIKLLGGTLAHDLKRLEYFGGALYADGKTANCALKIINEENTVLALCVAGTEIEDINITTI